jgi:hypothetical protein
MAEGQVVINIDGVDNFAPVVDSVTKGLGSLEAMAMRTSTAFSTLFSTLGADGLAAGAGLKAMVSGITDLGNDSGAATAELKGLTKELKTLSTQMLAISTRTATAATGMKDFAAAVMSLSPLELASIADRLKAIASGIRSVTNASVESIEPIFDLSAAVELLSGTLVNAAAAIPPAAEAMASVGGGATASAAQITALGESIVGLGATITALAAETGAVATELKAMGAAAITAAEALAAEKAEAAATAKAQAALAAATKTTDTAMKGLMKSMAPLIAMFAAFKVVTYMLGSESKLETLEARLNAVSTSSEQAHGRLLALQGMSERLAIPVEKLGDAYIKLRLSGINATESMVTAVTNISAVTGKSVDQVAKMISKASLDATRALKEFGIAAKNEGQEIVVSFHGQTERIGRDQQSIVDYMEKIGNHAYADQAKARANTLGGAFEGLKAKVFNVATAFMADSGLKGAMMGAVKWMDDLFTSLGKNTSEVARWGSMFVDVMKIAGNAIGTMVHIALDMLGMLGRALTTVFGSLKTLVTEGPAAAAQYFKAHGGALVAGRNDLMQHAAEGLSGMGDAARHLMETAAGGSVTSSKGKTAGLGGNTDTNDNPYGKPKKEKQSNDPDKWMKDLHDPQMMADLKGLRTELDAIGELMLKVKITSGGAFNAAQLKEFSGEVVQARKDFDAAVKEYETLDAHGATPEAKHKALQMMEQKWTELGKAEKTLMEANYADVTKGVGTLEQTFAVAMGLAGYKGALSFSDGFAKVSAAVGASKAKLIADIETLAAQVTKAPTEAAQAELTKLLALLKQVEGMEKTLAEESRRPTDNAIKAAGSRGPTDDNRGRVASAISAASGEAAGIKAKGSGANADELARLEHLNTELAKLQKEARAADKAFGSLGVSMKAKFADAKDQLVSLNDYLGTALIDTMNAFGTATANAFGDMSRHSKTAGAAFSDAMKQALKATAKSFGDFFVGHAMAKFAEGLWPPNPAALAAGAGYMVAAGAMYALAGGGGNSAGGSGGGGGSSNQIDQQRNAAQTQQSRTVQMQWSGEYIVLGKNDPESIDNLAKMMSSVANQNIIVQVT